MLIAATLIIFLVGALTVIAVFAWQATPGPRSKKAFASAILRKAPLASDAPLIPATSWGGPTMTKSLYIT